MEHKARKRFGQNFLHDTSVIYRIVSAINPKRDDNLVEIGPGKGALTLALSDKVNTLHAIELDRDLVAFLKVAFIPHPGIKLHQGDALSYDFSTLFSEGRPLRVVGNLPYNISTPLIFHLLEYAGNIKDMHFMLQKEVVDRITAQPNCKDYSRLSIMTQYYCDTEKLFTVKPGSFTPQPKVDSAIVRLTPQQHKYGKAEDIALFSQIVAHCFTLRRKTIRNSLKKYFTDEEITGLGIDLQSRPENIDIASYVRIANYQHQKLSGNA